MGHRDKPTPPKGKGSRSGGREHDTELSRSLHDLPSALERADAILDTLRPSGPAMFLDYDGTLTPIVDRPEDAVLPADMRAALAGLAVAFPVAVISGRGLEDVRTRVGLAGLYYAGSHGFEMAWPDGTRHDAEQAADHLGALDAAEEALREDLRALDGVQVERKRFAIAIHYRRAGPEAFDTVRKAARTACEKQQKLRLKGGSKIIELQPDIDWDKGKALSFLLEELQKVGRTGVPIYIGDDLTDEDAFRALPPEGIGIAVGSAERSTAAHYRLENPAEVQAFLDRLGGSTR